MHKPYTIEQLEEMSPNELGEILVNMFIDNAYAYSYMKKLIQMGASLDAKDGGSWTPLHLAARDGHVEVVKAIIDSGASLDVRDANGLIPLHLACSYGRVDVIYLLLEAGAPLNIADDIGWTPLHYAAIWGGYGVRTTQILLNAGAVINIRDHNGKTPWDRAKPLVKGKIPQLNPNA